MARLTKKEQAIVDAYFAGRLDAKAISEPSVYNALRKAITGPALPETVAAAKLAPVIRPKDMWPVGITKPVYQDLSDTVADGIFAGAHPFETARKLDMVTELVAKGANSDAQLQKYAEFLQESQPGLTPEQFQNLLDARFRTLLSNRRKLIAQTEQHDAQQSGTLLRAELRGKKFKVWVSRGDSKVDPICQANEMQGWIPVNDAFQSGHMYPNVHPGDRCNLSFRTNEPTAANQRRVTQRSERTALAVES